MRVFAYFFFACSWAAAFAQQAVKNNPLDAHVKINEPHLRAQSAVEAEHARAKVPLCLNAMTTRDINQCYGVEFGITDDNYLQPVRAHSALLHPGDEAEITSATTAILRRRRSGMSYRKLACDAARDVCSGTNRPSIEWGCRITFTRHHVESFSVLGSGNDGPWKAWKTMKLFPTLPTDLGNRCCDYHISTTPTTTSMNLSRKATQRGGANSDAQKGPDQVDKITSPSAKRWNVSGVSI
jgi:hypothetical protein